MPEFFTTYLEPILAFVTGGGIVSLVRWRSLKKQAEAEAMKAVQEVYQATIKDLREDKDLMKKDNQELRDKVDELQRIVTQNSNDIQEMKQYRCIVTDCTLRNRG